MEIWKEIKGYENYKVSNLGNVINSDTNKQLKKCFSSNGYFIVQLYKDKKPKCQRVHQLVFENFTGIKSSIKFVIDHKDNNRINNNINNLQIVTTRYNSSKDKLNNSGEYCIYKNNGYWLVRLRENNIKISLGTFKNIEDAIKCRNNYFEKENKELENYINLQLKIKLLKNSL